MEDQEKKAKAKPAAKSTTKKVPATKSVDATDKKSSPAVKATKAVSKKAAPEVAAEKPAAKAKKVAAADAPATTKAVSKKAAPEVAAEKPATKAKKVAAADAPATKKAASKKAAPEVAAEKPAAKAKKVAAAPIAAESSPSAETPASPKVRTKPRRRELIRQGLWVPKHQRGKYGKQQAALEAERNAASGNPSKEKPAVEAPQKEDPKAKKSSAKSDQAASNRQDHKSDDYAKAPKGKGKGSDKKAGPGNAKVVPSEFSDFAKRVSTKAERKNERRQERKDKEAKEFNQGQGLFVEAIRLNRFVALSGVCSRRDADALIQEGKVKVNGKVVKEMGHKVMPGKDVVTYKEHDLRIKVFVYLLMNKPKNRLSTTDDERGRDTVMEIAERYTKARVYPVGRLDRNTTGLLLLTNDGDLTLKLTQASSKFTKVYNVRLDRDITDADLQTLRKGIELEDGFVKAEKVERTGLDNQNEIGIQVHSGANHVVRRMLDHLGYEVTALDRVKLGPLSKRGLARGQCRLLTDREVGFLKML